MTAVERNNQTRRIVTFFAAYLQELDQNFTNNEQKRYKQSINIRDGFHFSAVYGSVNATVPVQS